MLSEDLETLIASKKREIEKEKILLGILPTPEKPEKAEENIENDPSQETKCVSFKDKADLEYEKEEKQQHRKALYQLEENIPLELERYIRRYCGLPVMLKAGEYSPNNPLLRAERAAGDALLGLGEYERRRNTLRKIRQAQYRQYLDQQAKKKQEAKEEAERERREREEKERQREERERQILLEREKNSPERRASVCSVPVPNNNHVTKVDTGVQVDRVSRPLSVAVQTEDSELYRLSPPPGKLTLAERELSPRNVEIDNIQSNWDVTWDRRRSCGDNDERITKKTNREKLVSDLRHSYMPSIFDADAIQQRNVLAEKEAAERRQFYQQELKNQILEQQRIREERKSREKMLEQAEMRRLEEQLRMLRVAQEREINIQHDINHAMKDNAREFATKRTELQREIDIEQKKLIRPLVTSKHNYRYTSTSKSDTYPSRNDNYPSNLPFFYPNEKSFQPIDKTNKPYSFNIPKNSVFSENYDVDSYLRKNLNFRDKIDMEIDNIGKTITPIPTGNENQQIVEKALVHEPKQSKFSRNEADNLSIPVLRHSPQSKEVLSENSTKLSEAMIKVDDKWKVPAVQKNILKSLPSENGKNVNILTQLGSIRRQLQLEQLKLDKMLSKHDS